MLVGKVVAADRFEPAAAIIVQNKDDLVIPLLLETIPTPKEFKDAIESLSPEQQRFAKAFRSMQLASTLFGVCIIQIKPQLEKLLRLPDDCLTKEIALTQDLMELFIKYQIPSDLLSFTGGESESAAAKVAAVQAHVDKIKEMLAAARLKEIREQEEAKAKAEAERAAARARQLQQQHERQQQQ